MFIFIPTICVVEYAMWKKLHYRSENDIATSVLTSSNNNRQKQSFHVRFVRGYHCVSKQGKLSHKVVSGKHTENWSLKYHKTYVIWRDLIQLL